VALYLYAVLAEAPRRVPRRRGLRGEPLQSLRVGEVSVVAGTMATPPAVSRAGLRGHDAVVRTYARVISGLLPVRFGTVVADRAELARLLAPRAAELRAALRHVAGREQMTLRVAMPIGRRRPGPPGGPGARYLARRARAVGTAELAPLRRALAGLVRDERVERPGAVPALTSVYHLIDRGRARAYRAALRGALRRTRGIRVRASGPWAPYAFTPDVLP
jgi:hypothetical protein